MATLFRPYDSIKVGDKATASKTITDADVMLFAGLSGDVNPVHLDEEFAKKSIFGKRVAHGMLSAGLISAAIGTDLPGINSIYLGQDLKFLAPVFIGDTVTAEVEVVAKRDDKKIVTLKTTVRNQRGENVIEGQAVVKKVEG
jgi:3-hydroxybutyryl-CoA dehydratase